MMPTEQADRGARVYSAAGLGRELRTSNFLLALMAAAAENEREALAAWLMANSYATGHGDTVADLLGELDWQHRARAQALTAERDGLREGVKQRSDDWEPAAAQCGEEVNLWAVILYPGSRVSDIGIGGVKVQVPNDALKISRALSALPNPTTGA